MRYRRNSNGYPYIFSHAQSNKVTGVMVRQFLLPYMNMVDTKLEVDCIAESPAVSANVGNIAIGSGVVQNVGVAVGI